VAGSMRSISGRAAATTSACCTIRAHGPVAPDNDGETGAGSEGECLPGADAAEAFDGEVCAGVGGCRGLLVGLRRRLGVLEDAVEGVAAVAGGEDEAAPVLGE